MTNSRTFVDFLSCQIIPRLNNNPSCSEDRHVVFQTGRLTLIAIVHSCIAQKYCTTLVLFSSVPPVHFWLRYIVKLMISIQSQIHDFLFAISVPFCAHSCSEVFTHQSLKTVLLLVLRNGQFSPLSPHVVSLSFVKAHWCLWGPLWSLLLGPLLSHCLHSSGYHRFVSWCVSSPAPGWPLFYPAGAAATQLYSHQDLRKENMKMQNKYSVLI